MIRREHAGLRYLLHLPPGEGPHPLMLFLHGAGERGTDLSLVRKWGLPKRCALEPNFPFAMAAPQCPAEQTWSQQLIALDSLLDTLLHAHPLDAERVTVAGFSMGGGGALHFAAVRPDRVAVVVPVAAVDWWYIGDPAVAVEPLVGLPVWAFHGVEDEIVPFETTRIIINALRGHGAQPRLTEFEHHGHLIADAVFWSTDLYDWVTEVTQ